jgi:hypothetical protein
MKCNHCKNVAIVKESSNMYVCADCWVKRYFSFFIRSVQKNPLRKGE